jgi:flagellar biogenesis protein FliO
LPLLPLLLANAAPVWAAEAPAGQEEPSLFMAFAQMFIALAFILGLLFLLYWLLRRFNPGQMLNSAPGGLKIRGRLLLGARKSVILLEAGRQMLVVGVGEKELVLLRRIEDQEEIQEIRSQSETGFKKIMKRAARKQEGDK